MKNDEVLDEWYGYTNGGTFCKQSRSKDAHKNLIRPYEKFVSLEEMIEEIERRESEVRWIPNDKY